MYVESLQILSTALRQTGTSSDTLYKIAHPQHPSTVWTRSSLAHYNWLVEHTKAIRKLLPNKSHKSDSILEEILSITPNIPDNGFKPHPKCINTDEWQDLKHSVVFDDTTTCYKNYLKTKYHHWTTRTDKRTIKVEFVNGLPDYMKID
jgi:hypothetical protein